VDGHELGYVWRRLAGSSTPNHPSLGAEHLARLFVPHNSARAFAEFAKNLERIAVNGVSVSGLGVKLEHHDLGRVSSPTAKYFNASESGGRYALMSWARTTTAGVFIPFFALAIR